MMEKVLVTGAGGYIGSTLVPLLLETGYAVRAYDRFFFGEDTLPSHPQLEVVKGDLRQIGPATFVGIDYVIDLAALSNDPSGELFQKATWEINFVARAHVAALAKAAGCKRYVLPSSCSIYGWQAEGVIADETTPTNPLTTYAKANELAEKNVLPLASNDFCAIVVRQSTVYGYSPRMRLDLAINGMTYGAWKTGKLPLMRDGSQWRPMVHVKDTATALMFMLMADARKVNGQVFNVGSDRNNYQIAALGNIVAAAVPREVEIQWYGDADHRSYRVSFAKIELLGYRARFSAEDGVAEIVQALEDGRLANTEKCNTLDWYKKLVEWSAVLRAAEMDGKLIDL